jgi:hypothetical protein
MGDASFPDMNSGLDHPWKPGHRLVRPRSGAILAPRTLDLEGTFPGGGTSLPRPPAQPPGSDPLEVVRQRILRDGWSVGPPTTEGTTRSRHRALLAERDVAMDNTALRHLRLWQLLGVIEFAVAIMAGLLWLSLGHPTWQGDAITALAAFGAVGLVVSLARVDFVSTILIVTAPVEGPGVDGHGAGAPAQPSTLGVWGGRLLSRNWEVLGDRAGRRALQWSRGEEIEAVAIAGLERS